MKNLNNWYLKYQDIIDPVLIFIFVMGVFALCVLLSKETIKSWENKTLATIDIGDIVILLIIHASISRVTIKKK